MNNNPQKAVLRLPKQGDSISASGMIFHFLASSEDTGGEYALMEIAVLPGNGPPTHRHREQECFYVLEGEFEFQVGEQSITGDTGSFVNIPSKLFHGWRNVGQAIGRLQCLSLPGGMEKFFIEAGHIVNGSTATPTSPTPTDIQKQIALAPKYGIEVAPQKTGSSS